jgi:FkbM family methyltransferase
MAFEPQRACYYCLCGNAALTNTLRQMLCFHAAVSNGESPTIDVPALDLTTPFNVGGVRLDDEQYANHFKAIPREPVRCITIDELGLDRVDLMKIDVETMESKVLVGAFETIKKCRPVIVAEAIFLECGDKENANLAAMRTILKTLDYDARFIKTMLYSPDNIRHTTEAIFPDGDRNIVAIPNEDSKPDWFAKLPSIYE